jgi:hypothetical protein
VQVLTNGNDAIVPATTEGRFAVTGSILAGVAVIPLQVSKLAQAYFQREQDTCVPATDGDIEGAYCLFPEEAGDRAGQTTAELSTAQADAIAARVLTLIEEREASRQQQGEEQTRGADANQAVDDGRGAACKACGAVGHPPDAVFCFQCSARLDGDQRERAEESPQHE